MDKHDHKHNQKHHHEHDHKEAAPQHHASGLHIPGQPLDGMENTEKPAPQADEKASRKDSRKEHRKHS